MMARYNENVSDFNFQVNDLVMYYIPIRRKGEPDKLQAKCKGPYRVVELSCETLALITLLEGQGKVEKVSVRRLRKITTPTNDTERDFGVLEKGVNMKKENVIQPKKRGRPAVCRRKKMKRSPVFEIPIPREERVAEPNSEIRRSSTIAQQQKRTDARVFCIAADCSCPRCYFLQ
jgi:hypothetical protein